MAGNLDKRFCECGNQHADFGPDGCLCENRKKTTKIWNYRAEVVLGFQVHGAKTKEEADKIWERFCELIWDEELSVEVQVKVLEREEGHGWVESEQF